MACMFTSIYINGSTAVATPDELNALVIGDTIRMVVVGNDPTLVGAKFVVSIDGADVSAGGFLVTNYITPIGENGILYFYYDYPITQAGGYNIEGYVNATPPAVTSAPQP